MSGAPALTEARAAGIEVRLDGTDLLVKAPSEPPAGVLDALSRHKADIVPLLRPARDGWCATDWHVFFEERAAIAEFDGSRETRRKSRRLAVAWSNGSTAIQCVRPMDAALHAATPTTLTTPCCPSVQKPLGMHGCIRAAGQLGTVHGRRKR